MTTITITVKELYEQAHQAGMKAGGVSTPAPMILKGSDGTVYFVEDGMCGFAWINIKPARGAFVQYLKSIDAGFPDSTYGGYSVWVSAFEQSIERKEAYAKAFSKVLADYGIKSNVGSRLD